jgi:hypothetical protein
MQKALVNGLRLRCGQHVARSSEESVVCIRNSTSYTVSALSLHTYRAHTYTPCQTGAHEMAAFRNLSFHKFLSQR